MSNAIVSTQSSTTVVQVAQSATKALDILHSFSSIDDQHEMVQKINTRVESELEVSFCKGIEKSLAVAESSHDFSKDTANLLQTVLDGDTADFSEVMAEKCQEINEAHQAILDVRAHFQAVIREEAQIQQDIVMMITQLQEKGGQLVAKAERLGANISMLEKAAKIASDFISADLSTRLARGADNGLLPWWCVACIAVATYLCEAGSASSKAHSREAKQEAAKCFQAIEQLAKFVDELEILDSYVKEMIAWWRKQEEVFKELEKLVDGKKTVKRYRIEALMKEFVKSEEVFANYKAQLESVQDHPKYERYLIHNT